jgi:menaquinone reductase, molybdopterin-binding-like subunit
MDRRDFIKLTAVTGATTTLAACGSPENQLIRFVPDEDLVPGVSEWKPSICPLCRAGCGLTVRVVEGDAEVVRNGQTGVTRMGLARKLEGNPADPISQGRLCVRGQAAIQITYHPDRITQPMKRGGSRGSGEFTPVSWDDAIAWLVARLDGLAQANLRQSLAFLTPPRSSQRQHLIEQFLNGFGAPPPITYELFGDDVVRRANLLSFGREQLPTFDFAASRYVIGFGADFLGTWNSPVSQSASYGEMRQGRPGVRGSFVQVESRMSQTGANADEWVPARPGTEGVLALGFAHAIIAARLRPADAAGRAGRLIDGWSRGLPDYTPAAVEKVTGVPAARVERLGREFADRRPSVAVIGGAPLAHTNGLFHALAVNALNALVGSVEQPGGVFFTPQPVSASRPAATPQTPRTIQSFLSGIVAGDAAVQVLLVDGVNPMFGAPRAWRVREALEKIPFIASFGSFVDETSIFSDLILPDHSFLESWVGSIAESGATRAVVTTAPPVMRPLHQTRATTEVLLDVSRRLHQPIRPPLPQSFEEALTASSERQAASKPPIAAAPSAAGVKFVEARFDGPASDYPFYFLPYASQAFLDGGLAHLPWLQELPDVLSTAMWSSWVEINPRSAERLRIADGDIVELASQHGSLRAPALVSPGIAPDVVAMPAGQGHETFTRYASGRGANPVAILAPLVDEATGALAWAATRVRVTRVGDGAKQLILFAGEKREHPHELLR